MYNDNGYQQGHTLGYNPATTNNPFVDTLDSQAASRWPDLTRETGQTSQAGWQQQSMMDPNRAQNSPPFPDVFPGGGNWTIGPPNPPGWQPSMPRIPHNSQYYQLLQTQSRVPGMGGAPTSPTYPTSSSMSGFPQSQSYPPQYNSYGTAGTGGYATPPDVSQLDPVPQSQSWEQQNTSQQSFDPGYQNVSYQNQSHYSTGNYNPPQSSTIGSQGVEHPRDYIHKNKGYLEDRNEYHWKQVLNAFDALEEAWSKRAQQLQMEQQAYAQYGNNASQYDSVSALHIPLKCGS
jgi:hypothetical protein